MDLEECFNVLGGTLDTCSDKLLITRLGGFCFLMGL